MYHGLRDFYKSEEWTKLREVVLGERMLRDGELICERCGKSLVHPYDAILHHKIELNDRNVFDPAIALNPDNLMTVCHWCHDAIHERWGHQRSRHVYIVYG